MSRPPPPPKLHEEFVKRFPELDQAWQMIADAGRKGPLDDKTARLVKLAVAMGAMREGPVHASVRKALAMGITQDEIEQVVALSAGTLGLPATAAVFSWVRDVVGKEPSSR